jgi:alpha-N-arabinofuranosidase
VLHLKLVNASSVDQPITVSLEGVIGERAAKMSSLHGATYDATNTLTDPNLIRPVDVVVRVSGRNWKHTVPALTIEVMDVPLR